MEKPTYFLKTDEHPITISQFSRKHALHSSTIRRKLTDNNIQTYKQGLSIMFLESDLIPHVNLHNRKEALILEVEEKANEKIESYKKRTDMLERLLESRDQHMSLLIDDINSKNEQIRDLIELNKKIADQLTNFNDHCHKLEKVNDELQSIHLIIKGNYKDKN